MPAVLEFEFDAKFSLVGPAAKRSLMGAASKSGSTALKFARAEMTRKIRGQKAFRAGSVREALSLVYPRNKEVLIWRLLGKGSVMPVSAFPGVRQTRKGVSVQVNPGKRKVIAHAFIATMKSGHKGVFMREGQASMSPIQGYKGFKHNAGRRKQPIRELYTSRVADAFGDQAPAVLALASTKFVETYARLLPLELQKELGK